MYGGNNIPQPKKFHFIPGAILTIRVISQKKMTKVKNTLARAYR